MKPTNPHTPPNIDARYRTMVILWFALLMNIGLFFIVSLFMPSSDAAATSTNTLLTVVLTALGTFLVVLSFAVKRKFFERSVDRQEVDLVQKGLVIACVMCESSAILGLLERLLVDYREYYLLFVIAAIGIALHFPRREHLLAATYKFSRGGATS